MAKKKKKRCGHGKHFWKDYWSRKHKEIRIKCIHCGEPGQLNLEMN